MDRSGLMSIQGSERSIEAVWMWHATVTAEGEPRNVHSGEDLQYHLGMSAVPASRTTDTDPSTVLLLASVATCVGTCVPLMPVAV